MSMDLHQRMLVQTLSGVLAGVLIQIEPSDPLAVWEQLSDGMISGI